MRFILIPSPPDLPKKWNLVYKARVMAIDALATQALRSEYIKKHGSWGLLKKWLANTSGHKCWYCEAKSSRAPFDVDHYRPKLGITVDDVNIVGHDGYYWLAYEWSNFRLSCQRCNRPEQDHTGTLHGKANEFPIQDEEHRCLVPANPLGAESPRLLDPCVQADCALLAHGLDGEVKPAASADTWEYRRADYTIRRLGFNKWATPENKRNQWQTLATLLLIAGNNANQDVIAELKRHLSWDHEYSSFFRSAIGTHREKAWVDALL